MRRLVARLEQQALLRVHRERLGRRDAKGESIEPLGVGHETAEAHLSWRRRGRPPQRRDLEDGVAANRRQRTQLRRPPPSSDFSTIFDNLWVQTCFYNVKVLHEILEQPIGLPDRPQGFHDSDFRFLFWHN